MLDKNENKVSLPFGCDTLIVVVHTVMCEPFVSHVQRSGKKRSINYAIILCYGVSICKYGAHWHMKFSLINGCGTCENNINDHFLKCHL